jgi:DNA modification methylase
MAKRIRPKQRAHCIDVGPSQSPSNAPATTRELAIADQIELVAIDDLILPSRRLRHATERQIHDLMNIIRTVGFVVPLVVDEKLCVWAGTNRLEAARRLGLSVVPTVKFRSLSEPQKRAFRIADNKLQERTRWDRRQLAIELPELAPLLSEQGLDISITGFSAAEIDQITFDLEEQSHDPTDDFDKQWLPKIPISRSGDIFRLGDHILCCGDARDKDLIRRLVGNKLAAMSFLDPPYNVRVRDIVGRGKVKHAEFAMASGEMAPDEFEIFLENTLSAAAAASLDSAVHYVCTDWRHVDALIRSAQKVYSKMLNLAVWVKSNAGQGSFYRSQHELIGVFRVGGEPHLNNVELGRHGRSRSNVWSYPGVNAFRAGRMEDLRAHPTTKPIAMVCDAIKDCTRPDDTVLDTFCGSGTTILAAERVGRRAVCIETEPRFIDLTIRRWQDFTERDAVHVDEGASFEGLTTIRGHRSRCDE